jgi:uncharacterized repeat protein (TIGR03803 family)
MRRFGAIGCEFVRLRAILWASNWTPPLRNSIADRPLTPGGKCNNFEAPELRTVMKIRFYRLYTLPLIFLLSLLSAAAQTSPQQPVFSPNAGRNRLPGVPRLRQNPEQTRNTPNQAQPETAIPYDYQVLYSFCMPANCADGSQPLAGLIQDSAGNLYGTTQAGGNSNSLCSYGHGCGTVFKVDSAGQQTVLHAFCAETNCIDGYYPYADLIEDGAGNLYGTTAYGGANGSGTVFKVDNTGQETVLYSFCSTGGSKCTDGSAPMSALIEDSAGNLYGTTTFGGAHNFGTVFKLDTTNHQTVLYSFCSVGGLNCTDGYLPSGLIQDGSGNLYGTTQAGGSSAVNSNGGGTAFKLDSTGHLTVLYRFCSEPNCADGNTPYSGLILDGSGNLYGTTSGGGATNEGAVFKLDSSGHETLVYSFCPAGGTDCGDGISPRAGLIEDAAGNLFGTTFQGGEFDEGTVFELDNTGQETLLYNFCSSNQCADGAEPLAGLLEDSAGNLYGTTYQGGVNSDSFGGTVFKLVPGALVAPTSSPNPSYVTQSVTLSVVVSSYGTRPIPTGSVTFSEGTTVLGTVTLINGRASLQAKFNRRGTLAITTSYSGDENYQPASSQLQQVVLPQYTTSTTEASNLNPSTYGQAVTLTATVSSAGPTPTGTVTFKNGSATVGNASLSGGVAMLSVSTLPAGTLSITADYGGDAPSKTSKSSPLTQVVNRASSTTAVVSSKNPSLPGQTVKFTATVTSPTATPTGSVTFMDGSTALATKTLAKGKASYSTSTLGAGAHNITAIYEGTSNVSGSTSPLLVQTVN